MQVKVTRKKIKNINLKVRPDFTVELSAPESASQEYIDSFLEKKKDWIKKQIQFFKDNLTNETEKKYISGESVKYLGKNYRLKVHKGKEKYVKFMRGYIHLYCLENSDLEDKKELLQNWLRERAKDKIMIIAKKYLDRLEEVPHIKFRDMKTRWGSCNSEKKRIIFNWKLIEKSSYGIEYVVVHELVHLKCNNHSKTFFKYVSVKLPDWEKRRESLYK
ncbi:MAG: M48 family metallopeptidase [Cetobacterium sp.]|uniref:M48 family metallopeptidase n=1 Tax=Cetobacterium somerae TaxID=188913 RepID=UPI001F06311D|nr:SprT family zinc-dependent metalloprotease [Cetobacterium somerae]UPO96532.1 M48 family metallopeptidase [Cetobacterium somerae]WVJ01620.1 SprT family zinc-dependent metalloprotease [Cetobacterium somerae]